jgi:hypothetical protein
MGPSVFVILLRLAIPLTILRWPLAGGILAMLADASDVFILEKSGWGLFQGDAYHRLDKLLDTYYLALECWIVLHWKDQLERRIGVGLFALRLGGLIGFEITDARMFFLLAPNVFENFYLLRLIFPQAGLAAVVAVAAILKLPQEYFMHYREFATWEYLRSALFYGIF